VAERDGHPRQNPAYRPATEKASEAGLFLWARFAGSRAPVAARAPIARTANAIDDLLTWSEPLGRDLFEEGTIVDYLAAHEERAHNPRRQGTTVASCRSGASCAGSAGETACPIHSSLEPPPKPRQERDWLERDEFRRLLDAAGRPERNLPGLAERDRLVLLALVTTGLRRSELCALEWRDLELDGRKRSLLVRCGKGGKPRRQPVPAGLARELVKLRDMRQPDAADPVFCGLAGRRLPETILANIIRRPPHAPASRSTSRPTPCASRRRRGFARSSATRVSSRSTSATPTSRRFARYAHVDRDELFDAAGRLEQLATPQYGGAAPTDGRPTEAEQHDSARASAGGPEHVSTDPPGPHRRRVRRGRRRRRSR